MTALVVPDDDRGRASAIEALRSGSIVAVPTDTVYGLAVALDTPGGIERLFRVKRRPPEKGIVLLLDDAAQAAALGEMTAAAEALAAACWPGGLTIVLRRRPDVALPDELTGGAATIGLRVPDHLSPRALARALGPLPVTSANVSGAPEGHDAGEIEAILGDAIELILDGGAARGGLPSTVVDCSTDEPRMLRPGAIAASRLAAVLDPAGIRHGLGDGSEPA
jgi:L-threonylcarbamoyladenylate synthase